MKIFKRFNSADFVILLAIAAIICALFFRNTLEKLTEKMFYRTAVSYTVTVQGDEKNILHEGMLLFNENETLIGEVKSIENNSENLYNVIIKTEGIKDDLGTYIGDSEFIAPGKKIKLYTDASDYLECIVKKVES